MTEHPHEEVRRLFDMVLDLPMNERGPMLEHECAGDDGLKARILAMIATAEDDRFLSDATASEQPTIAPPGRETPGAHIGRYKLLEQIGEGGFGSVWAAEQREPVKRRVAIKIIKLGMDTKQVIARFEAERQALALMDHPNIARVLDAGSTETGRPFFVMELVKGVPILEYCDTERLDTSARLDLFTRVCHAIQHAHQKGIIHRDIKPSNVLVTMHDGVPVPKVIDFGIAKATNQELTEKTVYTQHRQLIGTPAYMSPEQAEMSGLDVDTRSDIYSLGVLLYEMLTGTTPFSQEELASAGFEGMLRLIREVEPHKPSTRLSTLGETATHAATIRRTDVRKLGGLLRGELDWIVMKCLEKDRTRRYDTANGLALDIRRHIANEPVLAGPPGSAYVLRKFVRRHKAQVAGAVILGTSLILGLAGTTYAMTWALNERDRAEDAERVASARAEELESVAEFQSEQLSAADVPMMGIGIRRSILDRVPADLRPDLSRSLDHVNFTDVALGAVGSHVLVPATEAIDRSFDDQPLVRARLLQAVADTCRALGLLEHATYAQSHALDIRKRELGNAHPETLGSMADAAELSIARGDFEDAETLYERALETSRTILGHDHPDTLRCSHGLANTLEKQGRLSAAEALVRATFEDRRRVHGEFHPDTLESANRLAGVLILQGRYDDARTYQQMALDGRRSVLGNDDSKTLATVSNMGLLLARQGRLDDAEPYFQEALDGYRRTLGDVHPSTLVLVNNLGQLHSKLGNDPEAERLFREAIDGQVESLGREHPSTLTTFSNLAIVLNSRGRSEEAIAVGRATLEGRRRVLGDDHPDTLTSMNLLGRFLWTHGDLDESATCYRMTLDGRQRVLGDDHPDTLAPMYNLGLVRLAQGRDADAQALFRQELELCRRVYGDDHPSTLMSIHNLAVALQSAGDPGEAESLAREAISGRQRVLGDEHSLTLASMATLGVVLARKGEAEEAIELTSAALERCRLLHSPDDWRLGVALGQHGRALLSLDRLDDAEEALLSAHVILLTARGSMFRYTRDVASALSEVYDARHELDPDGGHDRVAGEWRAKAEPS